MSARTPNEMLRYSTMVSDLEGMKSALEAGADMVVASGALKEALCNKYWEGFDFLMTTFSGQGLSGTEALRFAASQGLVDRVKELLPISDPLHDNSVALRWAASSGQAEVVSILLDVSDLRADDGLSLRWAVQGRHEAVVKLLLPFSPVESARQNLEDTDDLLYLDSIIQSSLLKKKHGATDLCPMRSAKGL